MCLTRLSTLVDLIKEGQKLVPVPFKKQTKLKIV